MALTDTSFINSFQSQPVDYVQLFSRGYNINEQMPWSETSRRKRALEDFQISMQQQRFAAQQAAQAQEMQQKAQLFPFQLQRAQRMASGSYDAPAPNKFQGYLDQLRQITAPAEVVENTQEVVEAPLPSTEAAIPPFGIDPDAPVF